jgi:hypothetical protein
MSIDISVAWKAETYEQYSLISYSKRECRLKVFEDRVQRGIFRALWKWQEDEKNCLDLYHSPIIIGAIKGTGIWHIW